MESFEPDGSSGRQRGAMFVQVKRWGGDQVD